MSHAATFDEKAIIRALVTVVEPCLGGGCLFAENQFEGEHSEQATASLERALRIEPRNPILWHNLADVRLQQGDWSRAASLATK